MKNNVVIMVALVVLVIIFSAGSSSAKIIADNALVEFTSGIIFDPGNQSKQPTVFTSGEKITIRVPHSRLTDCGGCTVSLKSDSSDVTFQNIIQKTYYIEAVMVISPNIALGRNVLTKIETEHKGRKNEVNASLRIISNTPPTADAVYPDTVPSFTSFPVDCSGSLSGTNINEGNDRVWRCKVKVLDESGKVVISSREKTAKPGEAILPISVKTGAAGVNRIVVEVEDTLGAVSVFNGYVNVGTVGTSFKNVPSVLINSTFTCVYSDCVINYYINDFGKSLSVECVDITNVDSSGSPSFKGSDQACVLNLTKPGVYKIKVVARFILVSNANGFIYSNKGEAIVQVFASQNISGAAVTKTATPYATVQPTSTYRQPAASITTSTPATLTTAIANNVDCTGQCGDEGKSSPGLGVLAAIFALVILARRIRK